MNIRYLALALFLLLSGPGLQSSSAGGIPSSEVYVFSDVVHGYSLPVDSHWKIERAENSLNATRIYLSYPTDQS